MNQQDLYAALLRNYISYNRLYEMTTKALYCREDSTNQINVYIDLNSFMKQMWSDRHREFTLKNDNGITASIINACAHYRNYFWTRHMIKSNFYLVWGYNTPTYLPLEYNAHFRERIMTMPRAQELLEYTKKSLTFLCQYLPQIYFIDADEYETAAAIYTLISENKSMNIVISRDVYAYQLVAYCPNTFLYRPRKQSIDGKSVDASWIVTKTNLYNAIRHDLGYKIIQAKPAEAKNLEYVLALAGLRDRHVSGAMTFNRACTLIANVERIAPEHLEDIRTFQYSIIFNPIEYERGIKTVGENDIILKDQMLDVRKAAEALRASPKFIEMKNGIVDLYNPQAVQEINDHEFVEYPLELMEL